MDSFAKVIERWETASELARDIGQKEVTVRAWKARGIPGPNWLAVVEAAKARGFSDITYERLAKIAAAPGASEEAA